MRSKPVCLIILDGWGHREDSKNNAIAKAQTPFFDALWRQCPHALLDASEEAVGLPGGTIGNSEVGHMTIGAGKTIDTELVRISKAIQNHELENNSVMVKLFAHMKKYGSALHILGLLSPAGVHSHQAHLHGLLAACKQAKIKKVVIHAFTDGRDSPPQDNFKYLQELEKIIGHLGIGHIGTATGRYFAMDRDKNWQRTEKAEMALFAGQGKTYKGQKPSNVLKQLYQEGVMDEYLEPIIFLDDTGKACKIETNDGIFFFNFRTDRPRQLSFKIAERAKAQNLFFATMTEYHPDLAAMVAFPPQKLNTTLSAEISQAGLKQAHIAETEKYGHVTFFFNGGKETPHEGEEHFLIESRKDVATHDFAPQMRAKEIADKAIERAKAGDDFIVLNFANADMVGHTANQPAIIAAVETVDRELKRVCEAVLAAGGIALITADHGNAELNLHPDTGDKHTAHTTNQVPFILVSDQDAKRLPTDKAGYTLHAKNGTLADIAPTILELMGLSCPKSMTGKSLVARS